MEDKNILTKFRPSNLEDFVCDTRTLEKIKLHMFNEKHSFRTFLIYGPPGVGKTTLSRIFAKSLGTVKDYQEINCASDRGIDTAREILNSLSGYPLFDKHKILCLDEVHMLTVQAQNALLKGVEDIQDSNFLLLLTTNPENIIKTLQSRCFQLNLGNQNVKDENFRKNLKKIVLRIQDSEFDQPQKAQ